MTAASVVAATWSKRWRWARAVLVGRAYAYGLGAAGGAGVSQAIEILQTDLIRTLKLLGCASVVNLDASYVDVPADWQRERGVTARL